MKNIVYLNGQFLPEDQATISIMDRGFLFGDGIYEVVPVINGKLVDKHYFLERLGNSLGAIDLEWPCTPEEYLALLIEIVERNGIEEGSVYTQVTRGVAERDFAYPVGVSPTLVAWGSSRAIVDNPLSETGVKVVTVPDLRWQAAFEGWMVEDGMITEGASSSAFIVREGRIITRPLSNAVLPGIRRRVILEAAGKRKLGIEERLFSVAEAMAADEACLSSATTLVLPVVSIDGKQIGDGKPGPVTRLMRSLYIEAARQEAARG